jgi:hypothetical protein
MRASPNELAEQLTLLEHELLTTIDPVELLQLKWHGAESARAPSISTYINWFTMVCQHAQRCHRLSVARTQPCMHRWPPVLQRPSSPMLPTKERRAFSNVPPRLLWFVIDNAQRPQRLLLASICLLVCALHALYCLRLIRCHVCYAVCVCVCVCVCVRLAMLGIGKLQCCHGDSHWSIQAHIAIYTCLACMSREWGINRPWMDGCMDGWID